MAATSGAGTPRFGSGTSGRASGGLPPRACRRRAPSACSRGRSSPALVRRAPVSSSDLRPFRTAVAATGDTSRARRGFKRKPQLLRTARKREDRTAVPLASRTDLP